MSLIRQSNEICLSLAPIADSMCNAKQMARHEKSMPESPVPLTALAQLGLRAPIWNFANSLAKRGCAARSAQ